MKINKLIPVENLKKDIARQPNEFTAAVFKGSALAYKLIIFALYKTVSQQNPIEQTKKNIYCGFSKNEFCEKLGIPIGSNTIRLIEKATEELSSSFLVLRNENAKKDNDIYSLKMPWFQKVEVLNNGDVNLKFNQEIADFFDFKIGYTALELLEIGNLQSFYAMRYYGFAKSKSGLAGAKGNAKNIWWFEFTETELRTLFEIDPKTYTRRQNFVDNVIKNPCEEVNEKTNIKIDLEYEKLGVGNYKWRFICSNKIEEVKKIKKTDTLQTKQYKQEMNAEKKLIAENPERFAELFEEEMQQPALFGSREIFARANAVSRLKKELGLL